MNKRNSESVTNWESTFPSTLEVESDSVVFAHRFIKIATSFILDKRGIFENQGDKFFKSRVIERLIIPLFDKDNAAAQLIIEKIDALREAIQKKYLREFAIVFYQKPDEEDVLEVFSFRLMYGSEGQVSMSLNSGIGSGELSQNLVQASFTGLDNTKSVFSATIKKVHKCIKQLKNLPTNSDASFRISLAKDTPENYMVKGYENSPIFYEINVETKAELGIICGGHHKVQLIAASKLLNSTITDLNTTVNSINQSIIAKPVKTKPTKGLQKKNSRTMKRSPYGKSETLNKRDADTVAP